MKEAAGEANMTVITIILIGIVLTVGTVIINNLLGSAGQKACVDGGGTWTGTTCTYEQ